MKNNRLLIALIFCCALLSFLIITVAANGFEYRMPALAEITAFTFIGAGIGFMTAVLMRKYGRYQQFDDTDHLTGLAGPQIFSKFFRIEWNRNLRANQTLSVIIADIDDFKELKKAYGHARASQCVKSVAEVFEKNLQRAGDFAASYGKSQFIGVLSDTTVNEANFLAEKIREGVQKLAIVHRRSSTGKILTISIGTASMTPSAQSDPGDLIEAAETAVLRVKNSGGNRVVSIDQQDT